MTAPVLAPISLPRFASAALHGRGGVEVEVERVVPEIAPLGAEVAPWP